MTSLQETCDAILQYLESGPQVDEGHEQSEEGLRAVPRPPGDSLVLASIRCLGRYLCFLSQSDSHQACTFKRAKYHLGCTSLCRDFR